MANPNNVAKKAEMAEAIKEKIAAAQSVVVVDYRGYTVSEVEELRTQMRKENIEYIVLKNAIVERAADLNGTDEAFKELLKGPSAFAFGVEDPAAPARILADFIKKTNKGEIKGGLINGEMSDANKMGALAKLPTREVLLSKLLGSMMAPVTNFAVLVNQIKGKVEEIGAETAAALAQSVAAEAAPAEETPAVEEAPAAEAPAEEAPVAEAAAPEETEEKPAE